MKKELMYLKRERYMARFGYALLLVYFAYNLYNGYMMQASEGYEQLKRHQLIGINLAAITVILFWAVGYEDQKHNEIKEIK